MESSHLLLQDVHCITFEEKKSIYKPLAITSMFYILSFASTNLKNCVVSNANNDMHTEYT